MLGLISRHARRFGTTGLRGNCMTAMGGGLGREVWRSVADRFFRYIHEKTRLLWTDDRHEIVS